MELRPKAIKDFITHYTNDTTCLGRNYDNFQHMPRTEISVFLSILRGKQQMMLKITAVEITIL